MYRLPGTYDPARPLRILALDGGPNTLTNIRCLQKIEQARPGFLASVDVFAGTSDGALSGLYLASRSQLTEPALESAARTLESMLSQVLAPNRFPLLCQHIQSIFTRILRMDERRALLQADKILRMLSATPNALRMVSGVSTWADHDDLEEFLRDKMLEGGLSPEPGKPGLRLCDLRHGMCIVAYSLGGEKGEDGKAKRQRPKIFTNFADEPEFRDPKAQAALKEWHNEDLEEDALDVALRSSSLPLFMPITHGHVDGAVYANNPSLCALTAILAHERRRHIAQQQIAGTEEPWDPGRVLSGVVMISMGADDTHFGGPDVQKVVGTRSIVRWGWWSWLLRGLPFSAADVLLLMDVVLNSDARATNFQVKQLLGERFNRVAPSGRSRTMEKFVSVLTGGVHELIQVSKETARAWADAKAPSRPAPGARPAPEPPPVQGDGIHLRMERFGRELHASLVVPKLRATSDPAASGPPQGVAAATAFNPDEQKVLDDIARVAESLDVRANVAHGESLEGTLRWIDKHWDLRPHGAATAGGSGAPTTDAAPPAGHAPTAGHAAT